MPCHANKNVYRKSPSCSEELDPFMKILTVTESFILPIILDILSSLIPMPLKVPN